MMSRSIFINLATKDVAASKRLFEGIGFAINPKYSNDDCICVEVAQNIAVLLISEQHFKHFTPKHIANSQDSAETLLCIGCESRDEVDAMVAKAILFGAKVSREAEDHGMMYSRWFDDYEGRSWELAYIEPPESSQKFAK
ncbi:MAG: hypothetical protein AUK35_09330 [Zetaproteobacteria bacterium CG2_30_46_52]|nr:MAG: hypothetical protein AUK35_09330 [Zetaproteobacteria bacterium CG2_30_46_52]